MRQHMRDVADPFRETLNPRMEEEPPRRSVVGAAARFVGAGLRRRRNRRPAPTGPPPPPPRLYRQDATISAPPNLSHDNVQPSVLHNLGLPGRPDAFRQNMLFYLGFGATSSVKVNARADNERVERGGSKCYVVQCYSYIQHGGTPTGIRGGRAGHRGVAVMRGLDLV